MDQFGLYLKNQREAKNIRLEEIASITKIHLHNLQLLERGEWSQLPPEPFIRGFIIAYAKYVGLDSKDTVHRFLEYKNNGAGGVETSNGGDVSFEHTASNDAETMLKRSVWSVRNLAIAGSVVTIVGVLSTVSYIGRRSSNRMVEQAHNDEQVSGESTVAEPFFDSPTSMELSDELASDQQKDSVAEVAVSPAQIASRQTAAEKKTAEVEPASVLAAPGAVTAALEQPKTVVGADTPQVERPVSKQAVKQHEVVVEGHERTWIKIVIDEQKPREMFLKEGENITLTAYEKIKVVLGNSTGTRVVHNGEVVAGEKYSGTIRSYKFPAGAKFPQDPPNRAVAKEPGEPEAANSAPASSPKVADPATSDDSN